MNYKRISLISLSVFMVLSGFRLLTKNKNILNSILKKRVTKFTQNEDYEISNAESPKVIPGLIAHPLIEELKKIGYNFESMNYDNDLWATGIKDGSSVSIIGKEIKSILIQPSYFYDPLEVFYIIDLITADNDLGQWILTQINGSENGKNNNKASISKSGITISFSSYKTNYEIKFTAI